MDEFQSYSIYGYLLEENKEKRKSLDHFYNNVTPIQVPASLIKESIHSHTILSPDGNPSQDDFDAVNALGPLASGITFSIYYNGSFYYY